MTMTIKEFIKQREIFLNSDDEGKDETSSDVINMLSNIRDEYILPLIGRPFYISEFSSEEREAVIDAFFTCLCETHFSYMMFAINQLEVSEHEDGISVIFDALTIDGRIIRDLDAIMDGSLCGYASWKLDWLYEGDVTK